MIDQANQEAIRRKRLQESLAPKPESQEANPAEKTEPQDEEAMDDDALSYEESSEQNLELDIY